MHSNIKDFVRKIKYLAFEYKEELLISAIIVLVGTASYGAGILSASKGHPPIEIRNQSVLSEPKVLGVSSTAVLISNKSTYPLGEGSSRVVASKNGKAYYFINCGGVSRISEKNKVYFESEKEAERAGYYLATNCKK